MAVPENVGVDHIQASIFGFLYEAFPHLQKNPIHDFSKTTKKSHKIHIFMILG